MFDKLELDKIKSSKEKWEQRNQKNMGNLINENRRSFTSVSGIVNNNLYTPLDVPEIKYEEYLGFPGDYPYTRGIYPQMYRSRLWTMRQYAGFGNAGDTNTRFHYLMKQGQSGLSVAFDLPTQLGYDSDHPLAQGEVGKVGVAIDSVEDMRILFKAIPLDKVTVSMTINASAIVLLAMYLVVAEEEGIAFNRLAGTIQNDFLKEITVRGLYIYPINFSMRLTVDIIAYCLEHIPRWNPISISGYHIREAGSTAVQEMAFAIADAIAYVEACLEYGLAVDSFCPRFSFFFNSFTNVLEEVSKFRAGRRYWSKIMKERYKVKSNESMMMRYHVQTGGVTLTAQQPLNNIIRVALQAYGAVLGGCQSLHTNSFDEALSLPSEQAVSVALRTQQIIAEESGATLTVDPLAGSYFIEAMTNKIEKEIDQYIITIDKLGGMANAIQEGYIQKEIANSAYEYQKKIESGEQGYVGINKHTIEEPPPSDLLKIDIKIGDCESEKVQHLRSRRDQIKWKEAMSHLTKISKTNENLMPAVIEAVRARATIGEICGVWREIYGEFRPTQFI
jgi:methylmalonyl-CoA mutase N-terminal domain/subunit